MNISPLGATVIEGCWWWLRVVLGGTALPSLGEGLGGFPPIGSYLPPLAPLCTC